MSDSQPNLRTRFSGSIRLLPLVTVAMMTLGCASTDMSQDASQGETEQAGQTARLVRQFDLPLLASGSAPTTAARNFQAPGVRGSLTPSGDWTLRVEVTHPRLRCASYEVGLRFGTGNADCSGVNWSTPTAFTSPRPQCNNASQVHTGSGTLASSAPEIATLNCARVVVRCTGACG
ncbi:hypothetical protein F2Q65_04840 [Thiohalocapsa marina]|uniref:Uncharacterized protein n=1 Tax=Thiohalocapsa marina TaxID=424902 RepID=A0A5M8FP77_9GAMM|nr:hypothetical protein [Thiohalocapsa marina]KAA6186698.1 hypothetical protein F2Q65_04840 [Thiohalocapsa marina]